MKITKNATIAILCLVAALGTEAPTYAADGGFKKRLSNIGQKIKKIKPGKKDTNTHDHHEDGKIKGLLARLRGKRRGGGASTFKGDWQWPVSAEDGTVVSSEFGPRWGREHRGMDIAGETGVPIFAAAAGTVIYAGDGLSGYGNVVILQHDDKTTSLYAHNHKLLVKEGQEVRQGARIAKLGSTGRSTGPHLHFEIRRGDVAKDPRKFLPASGPRVAAHRSPFVTTETQADIDSRVTE